MANLQSNAVRENSLGIFDRIDEIEAYIRQIIANTGSYPYLCKHVLVHKGVAGS